MDSEIRDILRDPQIGDPVKVALLPDLLKTEAAKSVVAPSRWQKILGSGPAIAAIASVLTLGISEAVKIYLKKEEAVETRSLEELKQEHLQWMDDAKRQFDVNMQSLDKEHERSLERLKFQFEVIRSALADHKSPADRADALLFLTEIKLLEGLDEAALIEWGHSDNVPSIASAEPVVARGERQITGSDYKRALGEDIYGPDTSGLDPTNEDLMRVLGCPIVTNGGNPALVRVDLPFEMKLSWNSSQTLSNVVVHEAAAPYFLEAFNKIVEEGLELHASEFGGTYNPRRRRGGSTWSNHTWAVEIDIDPDGNRLKWDEDRFTMHPGIVQAFKDAGFAWRGDRGFDAMSFVISTEALQEIEASGYQARISPDNCAEPASP